MNPKYFYLILAIFLIAGTASALNITATADANSILYTFNPPLPENSSIHFNNQEITSPITDTLLISELEPDRLYPLIVMVDGIPYQDITKTATAPSSLAYYLSTFGIILTVLAIMYLGRNVPYSGYIAALIALGGLVYVVKQETDFLIILAHVILFFVSGIFAAQQEVS